MIRGQESNGMICALYEIGLDKKFLSEEDKNGIHILGEDAVVGTDPVKYMGLYDETIEVVNFSSLYAILTCIVSPSLSAS